MIDKYFIPADRAEKLKELGFDEESICFYKNTEFLKATDQHWGMSLSGISKKLGYYIDDLVLAPLYCQAFSFFREKFGYFSSPTQSTALGKGVTYDWLITKDLDNGKVFVALVGYKASYEEAELACLDKLIEITEDLK